ncbi:uncharacterized protein LOC126905810 [Daktulosphaira vitifoliae]|uniref:uncharacterized protein LOC126905810 n=1 Tax=Daktulosphaira vitifoliae TaxID=58002 RepID=UPI0021A9992E|nr:uncharacterized protein LOC126905810 [Daktulosphaira vitifoliae]
MWSLVLIFIVTITYILFFSPIRFRNNSGPFFIFYKLPGPLYPLKYIFYYLFFTSVKSLLQYFDYHTKHGKTYENDGPHKLGDTLGYDATWFGGTNSDGQWILFSIDRRSDHKMSLGYVCLKIPGIGFMATSVLEDTLVKSKHNFTLDKSDATMNIPLRSWTFQFEGEMVFVDNPTKSTYVIINGQWQSTNEVWLLNRDWSSELFAESFALEKFNTFVKAILKKSKTNEVVHWEQIGKINAEVNIHGTTVEIKNIMALKDRSFGAVRDYSLIHRYVMFMMFLNNGQCVVFCAVCSKTSLSRLFYGYMSNENGRNINIDWSDFNMYQTGENGRTPEEINFIIRIDNQFHSIEIKCTNQRWFSIEKENITRNEQFAQCLFDDIPGKCFIQWQYSKESLRKTKLNNFDFESQDSKK